MTPLEWFGLALAGYVLVALVSKPRYSETANCHDCGETVPNEPYCRECGTRRPPNFEFWANRSYTDWLKFCWNNPRAPLGEGDVVEKREDWHRDTDEADA